MNDKVIVLGTDDDDEDKTIFQTEEDHRALEQEILGYDDDDTTEVDLG